MAPRAAEESVRRGQGRGEGAMSRGLVCAAELPGSLQSVRLRESVSDRSPGSQVERG